MPWLAAVGAVVSSVVNLVGSKSNADAQQNATNTEANAQMQSAQMQQDQYNQSRSDLSGYRKAGDKAEGQLSQLSSNPFNFQFNTSGPNADTSYQFRLNQGLAGVNASAAARGGYFSGATGQALTDYGQGAASQEYGNQFSRALQTRQNTVSELSNIANLGENAATQTGQFGANAAALSGQNVANSGQLQGQGQLAAKNSWNQGINSTVNDAGQFSQLMLYNYLRSQQPAVDQSGAQQDWSQRNSDINNMSMSPQQMYGGGGFGNNQFYWQ